MAESLRKKVVENTVPIVSNEVSANLECAVCLQTCIHPAELPCGHVFCYLCIKGIVNQGRRCAMCRQDIPVDYLDKPRLLNPLDVESIGQAFEDGHLWFYEGHNGWWQYDERTSIELESAYQKGERCCELLIAGFLYVADFDAMLQYRRNDPPKRRRIKRDLATTSKKGVAGIKATKNNSISNSSDPMPNELRQNPPISGTSQPGTSGDADSSSLQVEVSNRELQSTTMVQNEQSQRNQNSNAYHSESSNNALRPQVESSDDSLFRNIDLDSIINDTLDWTIEHIESLNLELLNDYEVLFQDVNNYSQSNVNTNRNRSVGELNNSSRLMPDSSTRPYRMYQNAAVRENSSTNNRHRTLTSENNSTLLNPNEQSQQRPLVTNNFVSPPQPPPRTRIAGRIRSKVLPSKQ